MLHSLYWEFIELFRLEVFKFLNDTHRERLLYSIHLVQEFIEIKDWLLVTFFTCLHNQLSSIYSTATKKRIPRCEKVDSSNEQIRVFPFTPFSVKILFQFKNLV